MAKHSKRALEGYLFIDHRNSPGVPEELIRNCGLPGMLPQMGKNLFEAPTLTCCHCQQVFMVNPDRTRDRGYCSTCDQYKCDAATCRDCMPFEKILDKVSTLQYKQANSLKASIWLPPSLSTITDTSSSLTTVPKGDTV